MYALILTALASPVPIVTPTLDLAEVRTPSAIAAEVDALLDPGDCLTLEEMQSIVAGVDWMAEVPCPCAFQVAWLQCGPGSTETWAGCLDFLNEQLAATRIALMGECLDAADGLADRAIELFEAAAAELILWCEGTSGASISEEDVLGLMDDAIDQAWREVCVIRDAIEAEYLDAAAQAMLAVNDCCEPL